MALSTVQLKAAMSEFSMDVMKGAVKDIGRAEWSDTSMDGLEVAGLVMTKVEQSVSWKDETSAEP